VAAITYRLVRSVSFETPGDTAREIVVGQAPARRAQRNAQAVVIGQAPARGAQRMAGRLYCTVFHCSVLYGPVQYCTVSFPCPFSVPPLQGAQRMAGKFC